MFRQLTSVIINVTVMKNVPVTKLCTAYVTSHWKTIRYINLKLTKLTDAHAHIYRGSVRLMYSSYLLIKVRLLPLNVHRLLKL